jgi:hypothetical protein
MGLDKGLEPAGDSGRFGPLPAFEKSLFLEALAWATKAGALNAGRFFSNNGAEGCTAGEVCASVFSFASSMFS